MQASEELRETFRAMDLDELTERLLSGVLTPQAAAVAKQVIDERTARGEPSAKSGPLFPSRYRRRIGVFGAIAFALLLMGIGRRVFKNARSGNGETK